MNTYTLISPMPTCTCRVTHFTHIVIVHNTEYRFIPIIPSQKLLTIFIHCMDKHIEIWHLRHNIPYCTTINVENVSPGVNLYAISKL